jgi:hypothetical protein
MWSGSDKKLEDVGKGIEDANSMRDSLAEERNAESSCAPSSSSEGSEHEGML